MQLANKKLLMIFIAGYPNPVLDEPVVHLQKNAEVQKNVSEAPAELQETIKDFSKGIQVYGFDQ